MADKVDKVGQRRIFLHEDFMSLTFWHYEKKQKPRRGRQKLSVI